MKLSNFPANSRTLPSAISRFFRLASSASLASALRFLASFFCRTVDRYRYKLPESGGFNTLNIVVNNAAPPITRADRQIEWTDKEWSAAIDVKTVGALRLIRETIHPQCIIFIFGTP